MDFRIKRQLAIISIVFAAILIPLVILIYIYAPRPTCEDNRKNQREEDVDCGGPCLPCALKHPEEMTVFWVRFVTTRENTYDVAAEVRNPNLKLGAYEFDYEFRLLDDQGVLVASRIGRSFLFPGQTAHLVETSAQTLRALKRATLTIKKVNWLFTNEVPPDVVIGDKRFKIDTVKKESSLSAVLANRSLLDFKEVFLTSLILDEQGNVLAANKITERDLRSGETRKVQFLWPRVIDEKNITIITEARVNTFGAVR